MRISIIMFGIIFMLISTFSYACTGITIKTNDDKMIQARTIEYGEGDLNSKIVISPKEKEFQSLTSDGKMNGHKWKAKYGFVGIAIISDLFIGEGIKNL